MKRVMIVLEYMLRENLKGVNVKTAPYPGFPTDVQQPMSALLSIVPGKSLIAESIWESRHKHIDELKKMGATIKVRKEGN